MNIDYNNSILNDIAGATGPTGLTGPQGTQGNPGPASAQGTE